MKKFLLAGLALCCAVVTASAGECAEMAASSTAVAVTLTLKGDIVDNLCASSAGADLAGFVKTHAKSCALMPGAAASGYSIYAEGRLSTFDAASNAGIAEFLKQEGSTLRVTVTARQAKDGTLSLVSIENQQ